jgi:small subunit ribosomal protein S1
VDIGSSLQGLVPQADLEKVPQADRGALQVGQDILVYVTAAPEAGGSVQLSLYLARKEQDWLAAEALQQQDTYWEGRVGGYNKGGLVVPFGHIRGFVPASQVSGVTRDLSGEDKLAHLAQFVGQQLAFKVVDVDRRQRRLILSERLGRAAQRTRQQEAVLTDLHKGDAVRGQVRALTEYGAFVELGGMVGLIHRTELAWFRVEHPVEIVQEGQEVEAHVLRVNRERGRVSLSLKRTYPDPWPTVMERYQLDQLVEGRVIRRTGAGVFILLDDGVLGFISQSDLRQGSHAEDELAIGQRVLARLVRIDGARRRLGLSLRRVQDSEWEEWRSRTAEQPAPVAVEEPTPVVTEEPTPVAAEEPTPVAAEEPTPVVTEEPAPVAAEEPTPVVTEEPTPAAAEEPTPVVTEEPTPVAAEEPTPVVTEEPAPAAAEEPTPVAVEEPTPVVTEEPTPAAAEEPTPVAAEEPTLVVTEEPAPSAVEEPSAEPGAEGTAPEA